MTSADLKHVNNVMFKHAIVYTSLNAHIFAKKISSKFLEMSTTDCSFTHCKYLFDFDAIKSLLSDLNPFFIFVSSNV